MKSLVVSAVVAVFASAAQASYLYWQLDGSEASPVTFTHATVWATQGEFGSPSDTAGVALQTTQYDLNNDNFVNVANPAPVSSVDTYVIDVSSFESGGWSFYIELKNYGSTVGYLFDNGTTSTSGGQVGNATYAGMVANNYIDTGLSLTPAAVWHGGSYSSVPEPTSGLLLAFGLALAALRRRKA